MDIYSSFLCVALAAVVAHGDAEAPLEEYLWRRGVVPAAALGYYRDGFVSLTETPFDLFKSDSEHCLVDAFALKFSES